MSDPYAREILRRNVAQICQTIGWNGIHSTPLDILVHVLEKYIRTLGTRATRYSEQFNRTEPNLHDLGLVFRDLHVQVPDLAEFTRCVPSIPIPFRVENFPKPKASNLNFLKPGSHEVVTRPMHVHEHLPPMYPEKEQDTPVVAGTVEILQNGVDNNESNRTMCTSPEISVAADCPEKPKEIFKRPIDPVVLPNIKRPRLRLDDEERAREISSVMMTMSGFLSPAREGKLPEARPPTIVSEKQYDKHKANSHSNASKVPILEKSDKKSRKNKLLNGKIMKSKRKDKSHKGESNRNKDSKLNKHPPGHLKSKNVKQMRNKLVMPASKAPPRSIMPPPPVPVLEINKPVIKQEPIEPVPPVSQNIIPGEETIPVPRRIPISKSPLVSNSIPANKNPSSTNLPLPETEIGTEIVAEDEKLASQPDRSKVNIFKRISNKSKEDKNVPEIFPEKSQSDTMISKLQNTVSGNDNISENKMNENIRVKSDETVANNNDSRAVDLSKEMDLRAHEVISIDDDSLDTNPVQHSQTMHTEPQPCINKSLQVPNPKELASVSPKIKKEKKHKDKKDKAAKLEAKLLKKQQQQLAIEIAQAEKQNVKLGNVKPPKSGRQRNESKLPVSAPNLSILPTMSSGRNVVLNSGHISGSDFHITNPALRGLPSTNLINNPFASSTGLIPGTYCQGSVGSGLPNPIHMHIGNYPHTSLSSSVKIPPILRRPSLEVIPVENDEERGMHGALGRDIDRYDTHKHPTIPNILQKHKSKYKDHRQNIFKMPPVQPDITIELNPPKMDPVRLESFTDPSISLLIHSHTMDQIPLQKSESPPAKIITPDETQQREVETFEKKKEKSHKKDKKDKDGIKIKKKKDKKDKNKDKSEKKREKEEKQEMKNRMKKEKKGKKKEKLGDGLVPKITLKLSSSNSNSPMPPSSPEIFKLNIKPIVKKDEEESIPMNEDLVTREHSRSPELAQISALVTRPPKQKHSKHNHGAESEAQSSSPPSGSSPPRKNRPNRPSSHSKYKRILFKPLSKKGHFEDDTASISEEPASASSEPADKASGPLPTPYYVDDDGNKIWVCPACGRPDNGSPMIGCDGCDGWYHWICVGITEEPGATEDWFCKSCLAKRGAMVLAGVTSGKKRGRKPKVEKIRDCH